MKRLGNDAIRQLTSRSSYKLKIVLNDWDDARASMIVKCAITIIYLVI